MVLALIGALILAGCYLSRTINQATASDVNNQSFTFANGAVFDAALVNISTTLCFTNNATNFQLTSTGGTATGTNSFSSGCTLVVGPNTDPTAAGGGSSFSVSSGGPQPGETITLDPCDFNSDLKTLTVSNRGLTTSSTVAVAGCQGNSGNSGNSIPATADNVTNQSFTFSTPPSGEVFNVRLQNVTTTLAFTASATLFSLTSTSIGANATGTSTVQVGVCTLTIASSNYDVAAGPQVGDVIRLNPCTIDISTRELTVTNNAVTVTSEQSTVTF
jgi:hypothetical protein